MASNMPACTGGADCCWVRGKPCQWLDGDECSLRRELGSWEAVHSDPRYLADPKPVWEANGVPDCGDFVCPDCLTRPALRES